MHISPNYIISAAEHSKSNEYVLIIYLFSHCWPFTITIAGIINTASMNSFFLQKEFPELILFLQLRVSGIEVLSQLVYTF